MHDVIIVSIPLIAILAGILFNRSDTRELRGEIRNLRADIEKRLDKVGARLDKMDARFDSIDAHLRQFFHLTGKMEGRIDEIAKR